MPRPKIPNLVKVGHYFYEVREIEGKLIGNNNDELLGLCDYENLVISVQVNVPPSHILETTLHELEHAMRFIANDKVGDDHERSVNTVAMHWAMFYVDNPHFIDWMKKMVAFIRK